MVKPYHLFGMVLIAQHIRRYMCDELILTHVFLVRLCSSEEAFII